MRYIMMELLESWQGFPERGICIELHPAGAPSPLAFAVVILVLDVHVLLLLLLFGVLEAIICAGGTQNGSATGPPSALRVLVVAKNWL